MGEVGHCHLNIDDILGRKTRDGGRADVVDRRAFGQSRYQGRLDAGKGLWPFGVGGDDLNGHPGVLLVATGYRLAETGLGAKGFSVRAEQVLQGQG